MLQLGRGCRHDLGCEYRFPQILPVILLTIFQEFAKAARNQHNSALYADEMALETAAAVGESPGCVPPEDSRWYLAPDVDVTLATIGQGKTEFTPTASEDGQRTRWKIFMKPHDTPPPRKAYAYVFNLRRDKKFHIRLSTEPIPPDDARIYNMIRLDFTKPSEEKTKGSQESYQQSTKKSRLAIRPITRTSGVMSRTSSALEQSKKRTTVTVRITKKVARRTNITPLPDGTSNPERSSSFASRSATPHDEPTTLGAIPKKETGEILRDGDRTPRCARSRLSRTSSTDGAEKSPRPKSRGDGSLTPKCSQLHPLRNPKTLNSSPDISQSCRKSSLDGALKFPPSESGDRNPPTEHSQLFLSSDLSPHETSNSPRSEPTDSSTTPDSPQPTSSRSSSPDRSISCPDEEPKPPCSIPGEGEDAPDIPPSPSLPPEDTEKFSEASVPVSSELPDLQNESVSPSSESRDGDVEPEVESSPHSLPEDGADPIAISASPSGVESPDPESSGPVYTANVESSVVSDTDSKSDTSLAAAESSATLGTEVPSSIALVLAQLSSSAVSSATPGLISSSGKATTADHQGAASRLGNMIANYTDDPVSGDFEDIEMVHLKPTVDAPTSLPSTELTEDDSQGGRSSRTVSVKVSVSVSPATSETLPETRNGGGGGDDGSWRPGKYEGGNTGIDDGQCHPSAAPTSPPSPEPTKVPAEASKPPCSPSLHSDTPSSGTESSRSSSPEQSGSESSSSSSMTSRSPSPETSQVESAILRAMTPDGSASPVLEIPGAYPVDAVNPASELEAACRSLSPDSGSPSLFLSSRSSSPESRSLTSAETPEDPSTLSRRSPSPVMGDSGRSGDSGRLGDSDRSGSSNSPRAPSPVPASSDLDDASEGGITRSPSPSSTSYSFSSPRSSSPASTDGPETRPSSPPRPSLPSFASSLASNLFGTSSALLAYSAEELGALLPNDEGDEDDDETF